MKTKVFVWIGVILAFLVAGALFLTDLDTAVLIAAALGYAAVLSSWLGFDIIKSCSVPPGCELQVFFTEIPGLDHSYSAVG